MKRRIFARASAAGSLACQAVGFGLIVAALSRLSYAGAPVPAPEIDAGSLVAGLTLLSGGILIVTNRAAGAQEPPRGIFTCQP